MGVGFHLRKDSFVFIQHICLSLCPVSANILRNSCLGVILQEPMAFSLVTPLPLSLSYQENMLSIVLGCVLQRQSLTNGFLKGRLWEKPSGWQRRCDRAGNIAKTLLPEKFLPRADVKHSSGHYLFLSEARRRGLYPSIGQSLV